MTELEGNDSYIAKKQREDTLATLKTVMPKNIKIRVALATVVSLVITGICMTNAGTVYGLYLADLIPSGKDVLLNIIEPLPEDVAIYYNVEGGGEVRGSKSQNLKAGDSSSAVVAVPSKGWAFSHWEWREDGIVHVSMQPYRIEEDVRADMTYTAIFKELETYQEDIYGDGASSGGNGEQGGNASDERSPFPPSDSNSEDQGYQEPGETDSKQEYSDDPRNQYLTGDTPLAGENYEEERKSGIDKTNQNEDMPEDLKDIIEDYYDTIKK